MSKSDHKKESSSNDTSLVPSVKRLRLLPLLCFFVSLLAFLAVVSHHAGDLDQGTGPPQNWIGLVGAWLSRWLIWLIGFNAYPLTGICLIASTRRLFARRSLRTPISWDYPLGFLLISLSGAMLWGIWPETWSTLAETLQISDTAGGALGALLCDPEHGWLYSVLNPTGCAILALFMLAVGVAILWLYDWQTLCLSIFQARRTRAETSTKAASPKKREKKTKAKNAGGIRERLSPKAGDQPVDGETTQKQPKTSSSPPEKEAKDKPGTPAKENTNQNPAPASTRTPPSRSEQKSSAPYELPPLHLLQSASKTESSVSPKEIEFKKQALQATLDSFGIEAEVGQATCGPRVTLLELHPAPGVKLERISRLHNNIAMELRAVSLRILTPIPGKNTVGIEVPNNNAKTVYLRDLMKSEEWKNTEAAIPLLLGRDISGDPVLLDLETAPHLLIAGATGSGKSVCINTLLMSLLYRFTPEELSLVMIDPKMVEFSLYTTLPHLVVPVINDVKKVPTALRWTIQEMEKRYKMLAAVGARNLKSFNEREPETEQVYDEDGNPIADKLPHIVVIIDELADIMISAKSEVENALTRIAQMSRAVGIHAILATQRPSVNVITGTIKANFPTRIAFKVTSQVDSRTIMDCKGAESLLGSGDMLFSPPGGSTLQRNQGAWVTESEIRKVVEHVSSQAEQQFEMDIFKSSEETGEKPPQVPAAAQPEDSRQEGQEDEQLIKQAVDIVLRDRRPTTSYIQRSLRIGYNRAANIIEILEERGIIGPQIGTAPRQILIDSQEESVAGQEEQTESASEDQTAAEGENTAS